MQGDRTVIRELNKNLGLLLVTINQYFLHARILKNWGVEELSEHFYKQSIREMRFSQRRRKTRRTGCRHRSMRSTSGLCQPCFVGKTKRHQRRAYRLAGNPAGTDCQNGFGKLYPTRGARGLKHKSLPNTAVLCCRNGIPQNGMPFFFGVYGGIRYHLPLQNIQSGTFYEPYIP